jgi:hypothetical protein
VIGELPLEPRERRRPTPTRLRARCVGHHEQRDRKENTSCVQGVRLLEKCYGLREIESNK